MELLVGLFVAAVVVTVIAVVGHGLWVLGRAILRAMFQLDDGGASPASACPRCGDPRGLRSGVCITCGHETVAARRRGLRSAINQIERMRDDGCLEPTVCDHAIETLKAAEQQLHRPVSGVERRAPRAVAPASPDALPPGTRRPMVVTPTYEIWGESTAAEPEPVDAELVPDGEVAAASPSAAAAAAPSPVPDFARDTEPAPTAFSPRRTLADMLQSFMEEKNIRWGELASGMLIVGSAIGLVISLRATLAELSERIHYFPALLFMLGTLAIHAAGLYTLRRWKLRSTSRGVLIIATLLVPLSFAAGILLSGTDAERKPVTSLEYISAVTVGLLAYGAITSMSARSLFVEGWWRLVVAVMGTSAGQLIINRLAEYEDTESSIVRATALFAVPLASFLVPTLTQLQQVAKKTRLGRARAAQTFTVLGIAAFALAVPLGLLIYRTGAVREILTVLSPSLSLAAAVVLGIGIAVHWRCESPQFAETRTVGTALAVFGGFLMAGAMVLAWPSPNVLIAVSVVTAIALVVLAVVGQAAVLHAGAAVAAAVAYLLIFLRLSVPLAEPRSSELVQALVMGRSALALMVAAAVVAGVGGWFVHARRSVVAWAYLGTAAGIAAVSGAIGLYAGFWSGVDADWTTLLFAVWSVASLVIASRPAASGWRPPASRLPPPASDLPTAASNQPSPASSLPPPALLTWCGSVMMFVTLLHLLGWNGWFASHLAGWELTVSNPLRLALISHALLIEALALAAWLGQRVTGGAKDQVQSGDEYRLGWLEPLTISGAMSAAVAVSLVLYVTPQTVGTHAVYAAVIASVWAIAGVVRRTPRLVSASYVAATVAIGFVVAACAAQRPWPEPPLGDLRHVQWQVIALGLWCAITTSACWFCQRSRDARELLREISPVIDRMLLGALVIVLVGLGVIGCYPGILVELGVVSPDHTSAQDLWHTHAHGVGSWWALSSVVLALCVVSAQRVTQTTWFAIIAITAAVPLLLSGSWETGRAVASGLRWTFAFYTLCWAAFLAARQQVAAGMQRLSQTALSRWVSPDNTVRDVAIAVGTLPVLGLTLLAAAQAASGRSWGGPLAETWFAQFTPTISFVVPLIILVVAMLTLAVREGIAAYALLGSIICECAIALSVALHVMDLGGLWTTSWSITLAQALAIGLGGYGLVWLTLSRWIDRSASLSQRSLLQAQVALAAAAIVGLSAWALAVLFVSPGGTAAELRLLGSWPSYAAAALAAACVAWHVRRSAWQLAALSVGLLVALAPLAAATACAVAAAWPWLGYHLVTGTWLGVGIATAGLAWWCGVVSPRPPWFSVLRMSSVVLGLAVFVLAIRGCGSDPERVWWTPAICGGLFVLWALLGISGRAQWGAYASVVSVLFGTCALWWDVALRRGFDFVVGGVYVIVIAGAATALFWLLVEIWCQNKRNESLDPRTLQELRVHWLLAVTLSALMGLFAVGGATVSVVARLGQGLASLTITDALGVTALAGLGLLLLAMLWDRQSRAVLLMLYFWGLITIAMGLNLLERTTDLGAELTVTAACLAGAGYIALTGHLWRWGANLVKWTVRLQIPDPIAKLEHTSRWLPGLNVVGTLLICFLGFVTIFVASERALRMAIAFAPALLAYGVGCLAQQQRRFVMQCFALLVLSLAAVYIGWADVRVAADHEPALMYAARLLISVAGATLLYAVVVARWLGPQSGWYEAVRRTSLILAATTISALAVVLALEVAHFTPRHPAPLATPEVIAISVMLAGFVVALLSMALWPGKDPLNLTEKGRAAYVYAAQLVAALLFAHVYVAENQLFHGRFREYWPYIVMLLSFGSVAFGELCVRRNWRVIAEPMLRTGGFLPLLPAVAAWAFSDTSYPLVLFCAGLVYVFLAITRRSFYAGVAAAVMGNGALWALLSEKGMQILVQPQLWLIPPAFSVLAAAHINRARLTESSLTAIRYICVMIIYLSSAGEMFMKLVVSGPEDWLRPIILASLAVAGMFAGILLRVRAFLYLGSSFLLLSIVAMVWNAGQLVHHTWPWWVFGISVGLAILVVFGVFEKHRHEVQALIARLRHWDA